MATDIDENPRPKRITVDPEKMGGQPIVRDTRMPVAGVLWQLADGRTPNEVLAYYPYLEPDDITAALRFAAQVVAGLRELPADDEDYQL